MNKAVFDSISLGVAVLSSVRLDNGLQLLDAENGEGHHIERARLLDENGDYLLDENGNYLTE